MNKVIEATGTEVAVFEEFAASLAEYKSRYEGVVYDLAVPEQEKQAKSDRLAIGKVISKLDATHKEEKAPLKAMVDLLDGERKRIKDQLLQLQTDIKEQIAEHEARIQAEKDELLRKASVFRDLREFEFSPTIEQVQGRIEQINALEIDDSYGDIKALAALNKEESLQILVPMLAGLKAIAAQEAEAERKEQERIAQERREREETIAREATERAKQEAADAIEREKAAKLKAEQDAKDAAERAEKAKQEAAEQAERDKAAAVARAEAEAERKAEEAERQRLAAIEQEKAATARREANTKHRAKINNAAVDAIVNTSAVSEKVAKGIVTAIAKHQIPCVHIAY